MAGQSEGRGNQALPFYHSANQPVPGLFYDNNSELHQSENFNHRSQLEQSQAMTATTSVANLLIPNTTISVPVNVNNASEASTSSSTNLLPADFLSQFISPLRMSTDVVSLSPVKLPVESGTNALVDFAQIGNIIGMSKFENRHVPLGEVAPSGASVSLINSLASFTEISGGSSESNGAMQQQPATASFVMFAGDQPESSQPHAISSISIVTKPDGAIPLASSSRIGASPNIEETDAIVEGTDETQSATPQQYLLIQDGNGRMLCFPLVFCNGQSGNFIFCL